MNSFSYRSYWKCALRFGQITTVYGAREPAVFNRLKVSVHVEILGLPITRFFSCTSGSLQSKEIVKTTGLGSTFGKQGDHQTKSRMAASKSYSVAIILFRNDLRVHDNETIFLANKNSTSILPVYCFDPRHYKGTYHFGFPKTGGHRLNFLLESVADLRKQFQSRGSDLIVRLGKPEDVLPELIQLLGLDDKAVIIYQKESMDEEVKVEQAISSKCQLPVITTWGHTLYHVDDLPFQPKHLPDVYTQFRKKVEDITCVRKVFTIPDKLKPLPSQIDSGVIPTFEDLGVEAPKKDPRSAFPFQGGETTALERLNNYLWGTDNVSSYKETRNGMIGAEFSTKFSTWLAHGCLSPRTIYWEIKKYEKERTANQSTYWVIFELLWRDYFRFVGLKYGNRLFFGEGIKGDNVRWKTDKNLFKAWQEGRTGVPYVDANMRELLATGFMSNRGRQNVASFLTKDLHLDWRLGAEWFESMLLDHDVCSNYGNWQYSAGIGNDPRENRKFNVVKQGLDYDADGEYVRLWVPELAGVKTGKVHCVWTLSSQQLASSNVSLGETYPNPIVVAPEWGRHFNRPGARNDREPGGAKGRGRGPQSGRGGRQTHNVGQKRGLDFYFSGSSGPR